MTDLAIAGAAGRMGRAIIAACQGERDLRVVHAFERAGSDVIGSDAGQLAGVGAISVPVRDEIAAVDFDVLIEFSNPAATVDHARHCAAAGCAMVIGTTGLDAADREAVAAAAEQVPIVFAANMSVGVNLTLKLLEIAARTLGRRVDVEVVEAHHRHKVDAPSGTALAMGRAVADAWGEDLDEVGVFTRHGQVGPRREGTIGFATLRGGDIIGEHTVLFVDEGERVEITHKAASRAIFAGGALRAARWVAGQAPGLYDMQDVLGLADA